MSAIDVLNAVAAQVTAPESRFAVDEVEVNGRTVKVYKNAPPQVRLVWLFGEADDEDIYLVFQDERITWGQARARVLEIANALIDDFGVGVGDSVGISMRNYPEWVLSFWAIQVAGACAVEMNSMWTGEELAYGVADSDCRVLICDEKRHHSLKGHLADSGVHQIVVRHEAELDAGATSWSDVTGAHTIPEVEFGHEDRSAMVYTSGTTAFPKGVVHSQRNVVSNLFTMGCMGAMIGMADAAAKGEDPMAVINNTDPLVMLVAVPLFHVTGSHCVMMPITAAKGTLVLMPKWDAEEALRLIEREQVTNFTGVPTMTMDMLASPDFETRDTSSLKAMGSGGSANPPHMVDKVNSSIKNASATQGYGLSEVAGMAIANGGLFYTANPTSTGVCSPVTEAKVVDEAGATVPAGERGELLLYGPQVFSGYHNKPEATAEAIDSDGWFRTGDIAVIDEDGFVTIVDRAKDLVIRGGENVGSAEVEAVIARHPAVHECAVFGVPHERLGEEVAVAVFPIAGQTLVADELRAFAADGLAAFKVPSRIFIYDEPLPKNANGKILKRQLRDEAVGGE